MFKALKGLGNIARHGISKSHRAIFIDPFEINATKLFTLPINFNGVAC